MLAVNLASSLIKIRVEFFQFKFGKSFHRILTEICDLSVVLGNYQRIFYHASERESLSSKTTELNSKENSLSK